MKDGVLAITGPSESEGRLRKKKGDVAITQRQKKLSGSEDY